MKKFRSFLLFFLLAAPLTGAGWQARRITSAEAKDHVGERATVCGLVAGTRYLESAKGKPTFLNFDRRYPNHTFTVVIWERDRGQFNPAPEVAYEGKRICVSGLIAAYRGQPQIVVKDKAQIVLAGQ